MSAHLPVGRPAVAPLVMIDDPGETTDLASNHPEIAARLGRRLDDARDRFASDDVRRPPGRVDHPETLLPRPEPARD